MLHLGVNAAADHKAAREQAVPRPLENGVRFPGDEGLVDLALPGGDDSVGTDLVPRREHQDVVQNHLLHGDLLFHALPQDSGLGGGDDGELVQGALGPDALEGADEDVGENNPQEHRAAEGAHQDDRGGQGKVEDVEEGEHVLPDDLALGFGFDAADAVVQALLHPLPHLLSREAHPRVGVEAPHRCGPAGRRRRGPAWFAVSIQTDSPFPFQ